ncbi:MAG: nicotinate phosphoribosyltransferase [Acidimicrobiia bacterium]|nr:nicotinate phosphoribosyltransferase [Acidimicrobiia bacterium]
MRVGSGIFTDFYELTMAAGYVREGIADDVATFDLFVRRLPDPRQYLVVAGLADVLDHLENLSINPDELAFLESTGRFADDALDAFSQLHFTGEVRAIAEGEVVFANEPIVSITASLIEAQIIETRLINLVGSQTMVASKAARVATACAGRSFVDFSARRDHGGDAAMQAARSAWIGGAAGTSLVSAGQRYGLPLSGTMAHAYVMSFDDERDAFRAFARTFPDGTTLLIDTYDTEEGARRVVEVAAELAGAGVRIAGVRLDSGDLLRLSKSVRQILDHGGLDDAAIFASGDLDEYRITELLAGGAPIDSFGVGTQLGTSADAPNLGAVYKLVADESGPKIKLAEDKVTLPAAKQVWRVPVGDTSHHDVITLADETIDGARPLLERVLADGERTGPAPTVDDAKARCAAALADLPSRLLTLQQRERPYEVRRSGALESLLAELTARHRDAKSS